MKDRPLAIFSIHAVMDNLSFHLKEFDPPLILKAMETVNVEAETVSKRYLGNDVFEWKNPWAAREAGSTPAPERRRGWLRRLTGRSGGNGKHREEPIDIFLSTTWKTIKCRRYHGASTFGFAKNRGLRLITNSTSRVNDTIYNDNAKYAIIYIADKTQKTALIDISGTIHWNYTPNRLRQTDMQSTDTIKAAIVACGLSKIIAPFAVEELQAQNRR
jgi:hypothetical protein